MRNGWIVACVLASFGFASARADEPEPVVNTVKLDIQLSGIGSEGCKIEIKPANPGCKFEAIVRDFDKIPVSGVLRVDTLAFEASALNADRNCPFAITVTEPNGKPRTFKRSVRLTAPKAGEAQPEVEQTFFLRTTAVAKKDKT